AEIASLLVAGRSSAKAWLAHEGTVNSLERPVLEFYSMRALAAPAAARRGENAAALAATREGALREVSLTGDAAALESRNRALGRLLSALQLIGRGERTSLDGAAALLREAVDGAPQGGVIRSWASSLLLSLGLEVEQGGDAAGAFSPYRSAVQPWRGAGTARSQSGRAWGMQGHFRERAGHTAS